MVSQSQITFGKAVKGRLQTGLLFIQTVLDCVFVLAPASWKDEACRGREHNSRKKLGELLVDYGVQFTVDR